MSRRVDTSSTTHMTEILSKHWRSCGISRTTFIWTPIGRIVLGNTELFWRTWMGQSTHLGMSVCSSKTRIILIGTCGWSSFQERGSWIGWRTIASVLANCFEMLVFGTNWKIKHSTVCQQTCKSSHKMVSGMWQTIGNIDFILSPHNWLPTKCHVGNTAQHCRLGLFQDSDFPGDFEDSKSTSGAVLWIFGSQTFVTISWMCKKQTSVSHSSTESEIISLDAWLRMDGIPALDLWDVVIEVLRSTNDTARQSKLAQGNLCTTGDHSRNKH